MSNNSSMLSFVEGIEGIKRSINAVMYNVLAEVVIRVDDYSPVGNRAYWKRPNSHKGYRPGHFRANWQLGVDRIPTMELPGRDVSGKSTVGRNLAAIPERAGYGKKYFLVNNVPYAMAIEYGHSTRAPVGVLGRVTTELPQIIADVCADIKANGGRVR